MSDRELLEKAAKAAGIEVVGYADRLLVLPEYEGSLIRRHESGGDVEWNPLASDADAFRLAVKLAMSVEIEEREEFSTWAYAGPAPRVYAMEMWRADRLAATRRAIVRAAAALAEAKEQP